MPLAADADGPTTMGYRLIIAGLATLLLGAESHAGSDSGMASLAPGETFSTRINGVYRDIRVCNDVGSAGDLTAIIGDHEPVRLAPGICHYSQGGRVRLRNDSRGGVRAIYLVSGIHQS
jgi:hypothetical protein